ncbi:hypothetical protein KIPB_008304 [Kipferlia bialata]|uniref:Uncharacterized protein n=1 Tax=Kipferlia bialata TaxID=797122 RepID=A0A9K3D359_9EUKA|nr:hypothetical protein KIPB_008304 [Kipferlia bialata]|eukprot:g8304.t1
MVGPLHTVQQDPSRAIDTQEVDGECADVSGVSQAGEGLTLPPPPDSVWRDLETSAATLCKTENEALRQMETECTRQLQSQREMYDSRIATLIQSLSDKDSVHKTEMETQRQGYEYQVATLTETLSRQERECTAKAERETLEHQSRIVTLTESLAEQERENQRMKEALESHNHTLPQRLEESQNKVKHLIQSLRVCQHTCRRLASEVIQRRQAEGEWEEGHHQMETQYHQEQAEVARDTTLERHSPPRAPESKRMPAELKDAVIEDPLDTSTGTCMECIGDSGDSGGDRDDVSSEGEQSQLGKTQDVVTSAETEVICDGTGVDRDVVMEEETEVEDTDVSYSDTYPVACPAHTYPSGCTGSAWYGLDG